MHVIVLMRSFAGAVGALLFVSVLAVAQVEEYAVGVNGVYYGWSNEGSVAPGDTFRIRRLWVNTTDSVVPLPIHPCEFTISTSAEVRFIDERCSEPVTELAPGDSAWAEKRWIVLSEPGRYDFRLQVPTERGGAPEQTVVSGPWTIVPTERRPAVVEPKPRLPVLLRFSRTARALLVTERDVEHVIREAARKSGYLPLIVSERAADAMAETTPYLLLEVHLANDGAYALSRCWIGEGGQRLSRLCDRTTTGGITSPVVFGLFLADFLEREIKQASNDRQ